MNIFDFILLVPPAYFCYKGIRKGFIKRVFAILGLILGAIISYAYHSDTAHLISKYWQSSSVDYLAYILPFIVVVVAMKLIAIAATKGLGIMALSPINVFLGALFGIVQGALFSAIISLLALVVNNLIDTPLRGLVKSSLLFNHFEEHLKVLLDLLAISV
jgi:uncharacterized membrane protein required for colicin V production